MRELALVFMRSLHITAGICATLVGLLVLTAAALELL
jgi:hypothetical protein